MQKELPFGMVTLQDVLTYAADVFCGLTEVIGRIIGQPTIALAGALQNEGYKQSLLSWLVAARELCSTHGWVETEERIGEVEKYLSGDQMMPIVLQSKVADLETHLLRILKQQLFFHAESKRLEEYWNWAEERKAWQEHFPLASLELGNADRCYLFDQPTACVFHAMRALEIGLVALAGKLNVPVQRDQWETIINNVESAIQKINGPQAGKDWKSKQEAYSSAALHFRYLKNAWRNHVMHVRHSYDDKKAAQIMQHVNDFISDLTGELGLEEPIAKQMRELRKQEQAEEENKDNA